MLDTDVLVAAVRSDRGASRALLTNALERRYSVLASVPLMLQYESVLTRPEHLTAAGISAADVEVLLNSIALVVEPIRISDLWRPVLPDSGDDLVLETAVNGQADVVVTFNRRHFVPAAAARARDSCARGRGATIGDSLMKKSNFALRLQPSLMEEARKVAKAEGVAVNQLINVAVAEKVSALRTEEYFAERAAQGDIKTALREQQRAGKGNAPVPGDELPKKATRHSR